MAIYDLGTASLAANGEVTGVGTTWKAPLTLIRVGATIVFKTEPVQIYTISEIISDTQINVYNPNSETVPAGTSYAILAHDGITVQGLAQDVAETLRYYQSRETEVADAVDAFNNFDSADFESKVAQVNTQHSDILLVGAQVSDDANQVSLDKDSSLSSALSAQSSSQDAMAYRDEARQYAESIGRVVKLFDNVALAVANRTFSQGDKVRTFYHNTAVTSDWTFRNNAPAGSEFAINVTSGGYLYLDTPNFASAGLTPGAYNPAVAARNRFVIEKLSRDSRFSNFSYGASGTYYVVGSIHPQRSNITINHEAGVTLIGRYDDPTLTAEQMGINAGHLFGFALFANPDNPVYDDSNYQITGAITGIKYILDGRIGTEFNASHSKPHNNNAIGFFRCSNCKVIGNGGVIMSDHRGINFDGDADNCHVDIGFATQTSNAPIQMKTAPARYGSVKVGAVYGLKFDDLAARAVVWCAGGTIDVEVGYYRWDGTIRPIIAYANQCEKLTFKGGLISGASQLVRMLDSGDVSVYGANINNTQSIVRISESSAGKVRNVSVTGITGGDTNLVYAVFDETKLTPLRLFSVFDNDFSLGANSFRIFGNRIDPLIYKCSNNATPEGMVSTFDWNLYTTNESTVVVSSSSTTIPLSLNYEVCSLAVSTGGSSYIVSVDLRPHTASSSTFVYSIQNSSASISVSRSGSKGAYSLTFTISAGTISFYNLHN